jgi:hypothetical protein
MNECENECECASRVLGFMFSFRAFCVIKREQGASCFIPLHLLVLAIILVKSGFTLHFHHPRKEKTSVAQVGITNGTKRFVGYDLGFVNFITLVLKHLKQPGVTCHHKIVLKAINQRTFSQALGSFASTFMKTTGSFLEGLLK